jgi:hypothetical protein
MRGGFGEDEEDLFCCVLATYGHLAWRFYWVDRGRHGAFEE